MPAEEDLKSWAHHASPSTVPDPVMQSVAGDDVSTRARRLFSGRSSFQCAPAGRDVRFVDSPSCGPGEGIFTLRITWSIGPEILSLRVQVSFVFSCQIDGKLKPVESKAPARLGTAGPNGGARRLEGSTVGSTGVPSKSPGLAWRSPLAAKPGAKPLGPGTASGKSTVGAPNTGRGKVLSPLHPNVKRPDACGPATGRGAAMRSTAGQGEEAVAARQGKPQAASIPAAPPTGQPLKVAVTKKRSPVPRKQQAAAKKAKAASESRCSAESEFDGEEGESQEVIADSDGDSD